MSHKALLFQELSLLASSGAGSVSVEMKKHGYIEKVVLLIPTDLVTDISLTIVQDNTAFAAENVLVKTGMTANTYHLYPRAPTVKADGTALTSLPYVKPVFAYGDKLTLALANANSDAKRVTVKIYYMPSEMN